MEPPYLTLFIASATDRLRVLEEEQLFRRIQAMSPQEFEEFDFDRRRLKNVDVKPEPLGMYTLTLVPIFFKCCYYYYGFIYLPIYLSVLIAFLTFVLIDSLKIVVPVLCLITTSLAWARSCIDSILLSPDSRKEFSWIVSWKSGSGRSGLLFLFDVRISLFF